MDQITIWAIIFQCILFLLAAIHLFSHNFKVLPPLLVIFILSFLPSILAMIFNIEVNLYSTIMYFMIIIMALYLGSALRFYDRYKWWDRIVHFLSGAVFIGFGIAIAKINPEIGKVGLLFFGFTFSVTLHVFWEVLEYISDCVFRSNAQRWQKIHTSTNHKSARAIQPAGLVDTMNDLICCLLGSALSITVWCLNL